MTALETFRLDGKVAVVTGGGRGLGAAAARALADAGADVVIAGRTESTLASVVDEIIASGGRASYAVLDVSDAKGVEHFFDHVVAEHGGVDVLLNNAGVEHQALLVETEALDFQRVVDINLAGTFYCARAFARVKGTSAQRTIINVGSIASEVGVRYQGAYAASKAGVVSLTKTLALELSRDDIRVNALCPGYFRTDMPAQVLADEEATKALMKKIPMRRVGEPEEIAGPVLFLASPASSYMTGTTLYFDGGYTA